MDLMDEATQFAVQVFHGKKRKASGLPAVFHSIEAAEIVSELTTDEQTRAAAVLHDTVEDAGVTIEQIREKFGARVAELVAAETENKREHADPGATWMVRKQEAIEFLRHTDDIAVKQIFLGDKLSNIRSFYQLKKSEGADMWRYFNQKDPEMHHWYYRTIADLLADLKETGPYKEYSELISRVFEEGET